jgi:hypothetical protein
MVVANFSSQPFLNRVAQRQQLLAKTSLKD